MIDMACIFTTGGVILFYKAFCTMKFDVLDILVKKVLIQDKTAENKYFVEPYNVKWRLANDLNLIFAVVYQEIFQVLYVDELLELMKQSFVKTVYPQVSIKHNLIKNIPEFEEEFSNVVRKWELQNQKVAQKDKIMRSWDKTDKGKEVTKRKPQEAAKDVKKKGTAGAESGEGDEEEADEETQQTNDGEKTPGSPSKGGDDVAEARKRLQDKFKKSGRKSTEKLKEPVEEKKSTKPPAKQNANYGINDKIDSKAMNKLNFANDKDSNDITAAKERYLGGTEEEPEEVKKGFVADDEEIELSDDDDQSKGPKKKGLFSKFSSGLKNITGNKVLEADDLIPILSKFKEDLMEKNVAEEIAKKVCESVKVNLVDRKTKAFTSSQATVKECLVDSLTKILTPKRNIDVIADAMRKKETGRPYVLTFIGVNGVGKSTNLAKVAYLLKSQGFSLMLAACDNFRSGAVEQLKTHGRCLEVPVFDKGYKDDPANIAREAIEEAARKKIDCVLIDTAGRMQDNEPLMRALAKLVAVNQPDLIIFVGEALVGNDAVDQLTKFNQALVDLSAKDSVREIDAILLTKFDTVDDKVGAAVSMSHTTGKPILFCGTGQKYTHLRKLNIKTVVHSLLS